MAGYSQVTNEGKPYSWKFTNVEEAMPVKMPAFDLKALQDEDAANALVKNKPWRFGHEFVVDHNLSNSGVWSTLPSGDRIWRIRYKSDGAKTLNFLFSDFYMPEGAKVYLYNHNHTDLLGAYDSKQNNDQRVLGTWLVSGEDITIEYFEPASKMGEGKLEVFKVIHGYRTTSDLTKDVDDSLNGSGNCNYDVDCFMAGIDEMKDINKKSVGIMITGGSGFCTGALVNNTSNDGTPYFLTANHCYDDNAAQWAFRFNWISPNPVCAANAGSTNNTDYYQTVSGATLRAKRYESDFCLVEITANIPATWDLVYAGWNRATTAPASTFGIHHPSGDIMKACRDLNPPVSDNTGDVDVWVVQDWDLGVTEGGSSGSPLFDNNGRIIGQLFGGAAACNGLNDNGQYDEYGRFDVSWNAGNTSASRLKEWLDPLNTNAMTLNYYPEQVTYALNAKASLAVGQEECGAEISPVVTLINKGTQALTSAQISYALNDGTPAVYSWTGNLAPDASINIELPEMDGEAGENTFDVSVLSPNGGTDEFPSDNIASVDFTVRVYEVANVSFELNNDFFGEETSWTLKNEAGTTLYSGGNYDSFETVNQTFVLTTEGCYTFTINDTADDGICCAFGDGSYSLTIAGEVIQEGGAFGSSEVTRFRLKNTLSSGSINLQSAVKVYPNPSSGLFTISGVTQELTYSLYNVLGQQVQSGRLSESSASVNISSASNGVYVLKVADKAGNQANFKLIKE